ncbi:MAG: hypothetical protein U5K38_06770 [Woeseiaceae bacterium]|nr:hypothetical protein [Woeseiaceae bacterium]
MDVNRPIDDNSAFRLNLMGHSADIPGRDVVNDKRWGFFGAYTWGLTGRTSLNVDWLSTRQDNIEDKGLPFDREGFSGPKALCDQADNDRVGRVGDQRCGDGYAMPASCRTASISVISSATWMTTRTSTWMWPPRASSTF